MQLALSWAAETAVSDCLEPQDFIHETGGQILAIDNGDQRILAGAFRTVYVDIEGAMNAGLSIEDVLDSHPAASDAINSVYDVQTDQFTEEALRLMGEGNGALNILIIDRLGVLPAFRGNGVGLAVLQQLFRRFGPGAGAVIIKPVPLQFSSCQSLGNLGVESRMEYNAFSTDERSSNDALRRHYATAGFRSLPGSDLMVRAAY